MGRPDGAHTHGHGGGGLAVVVVLVVIAAAAAKAIASAARDAVHVLAVAFEVVIIGLAVLAVVAAAAGLAWGGIRLYRWNARRRPLVASAAVRAEVVPSSPLAIEAPKPIVTGVLDDASSLVERTGAQ